MRRPERRVNAAAFLREFVRSPLLTASAMPSSAALARQASTLVPERGDPIVVELGPGTGTITEAIQARLHGRGRHIAVELSPRLAALLERRFGAVEVLCADAAELPAILADRGLAADVVVSALPWAAFAAAGPPSLVDALAATMARVQP